MAAPEHYRITFSGSLGNATAPQEEFSFGVSAGAADGAPFLTKSDLDTLASDLWGEVSDLALSMTNQVRVRECKVAFVNDLGLTPRDVTGAYIQGVHAPATSVGGAASGNTPLQVALAVSTHTNASGAVGRGRFYLPCPGIGTLEEDGRMSAAVRDAHATRAQTFLNGLRTHLGTRSMFLCVASGGSTVKALEPALYSITGVSVGRVLDTQRRRRGDLDEARVLLPVGF